MANLEKFQYRTENDHPNHLEEFLAPEECSIEELTMHAASHYYFNRQGWEKGWPILFALFMEETLLFTNDVFILCAAGMDGKPVFEVVTN